MRKNILITGASSGFGLLVANKLHQSGYNVIGTSRNPEKYVSKWPFKMIALDLDSEESVNTFSARIFKEIGHLDILINNAGFLVSGIAEETPIELGRQQLETNFWGTIKVTNAVLPYFRKQKFGKIITVGSIVGLVSFPNAAYYAASKHALEGYFKALRYELNEFNINVAMIEPSAFKTSIMDNSSSSLNKITDYNALRGKIEKFTADLVKSAEDPIIVAEKVLKVVQADKPKFRNVVGRGTNVLINLQHFAYGVLEKNVLKQLNISYKAVKMKAYTISRYSKEDKLQLTEVPKPTARENEVLIQIHSAGINQLDAKLKNGEFKLLMPYKFPLILGHDVSGTVVSIGSKVSQFKVGDEVFARPADFSIGTFAEYIAVNEKEVALKPKNISFEEAASIPLVGLTVWQALVEKAKLKKGQKVLIQAGSGGVGTLAIQLAKHLGATVATTTSAGNFELVKRLGADVVIDYKTQDFELILKDYDLVLNSQDQKTLEKSLRILKSGGQVISISGPPDTAFAKQRNLNFLMKIVFYFLSKKVRNQAKKYGADYSFLFMQANGKQLSELAELIEKEVIRPVMDKVFPFEQMNEAMSYVSSGLAKGKVVVKVK